MKKKRKKSNFNREKIKRIDITYFLFLAHNRWPFNMLTLWGFFTITIFESVSFFCILFSNVPTVCLLIGCCWIFIAFSKDITSELQSLNIRYEKSHMKNPSKVELYFCNIARAHSDVISYISEFNTTQEFKTFNVFLRTLLTICCSLYLFNSQLVEYKILFSIKKITVFNIPNCFFP